MTDALTVTIEGSHGKLTVDLLTGNVTAYEWEQHADAPEYGDIVRFDLGENAAYYKRPVQPGMWFDILDVGFWTDKGDYIEPEAEWRERRERA